MGNLIAVMTHCNERASEIIIGNKNHLVIYEQVCIVHVYVLQVCMYVFMYVCIYMS